MLLCVGGAGRSEGFPEAASSSKGRKRLVASLVALVEKYALDGVDFDWEAPRNPEEMGDYSRLLLAARTALRPTGKLVTVCHCHFFGGA